MQEGTRLCGSVHCSCAVVRFEGERKKRGRQWKSLRRWKPVRRACYDDDDDERMMIE